MSIAVDILSDPICPWCYIGKARRDRALADRPEHPLAFFWRPFQLNPDMPAEGMDRQQYLERKFGGREGAAQVYGAIARAAEADGLPIAFDKITRTPSTLDAHRLIAWSEAAGVQEPIVDALFERYFLRGEDISDRDLLADVAEDAGMPREAIVSALASDADVERVKKQDAAARQAGISGVPTFIVNSRHVLPGAQDPALWTRVIDEVTSRLAAETRDAGPDR